MVPASQSAGVERPPLGAQLDLRELDRNAVVSQWEPVCGPLILEEARTQLVRGLGVVQVFGAGCGQSATEPLRWHAETRHLLGPATRLNVRLAIAPARLVLAVTDLEGSLLGRFSLPGHSPRRAAQWLADVLTPLDRMGGGALPGLARRFGRAPTFTAQPREQFEALEGWYANAALALGWVHSTYVSATRVRTHPRTGDMRTDLTFEGERRIQVGMVPGDLGEREPYWYVILRPLRGPRMDPGRGHRVDETWCDATLTASQLARVPVSVQPNLVLRFLETAIAAAYGALMDTPTIPCDAPLRRREHGLG
jgi:hypothetical protein